MTKDQTTSSNEALDMSIHLKVIRGSSVKIHGSWSTANLEKRIKDMLRLANVSGIVNCIVKRYFPHVLPEHRWLTVKKDPTSKLYEVTVRCDKQAFECNLQIQEEYVTPELTASLMQVAENICERGWFGERRQRVQKVKVKKQPPPPALASTPPTAEPHAEVAVTVHSRVVAPQPEPKEVPANRVYFAWRQPVTQETVELATVAEEATDCTGGVEPPVVTEIVKLESIEPSPKELLILQINNTIESLEAGIVERLAEVQGLKDTQQSLLRVLESFKS